LSEWGFIWIERMDRELVGADGKGVVEKAVEWRIMDIVILRNSQKKWRKLTGSVERPIGAF